MSKNNSNKALKSDPKSNDEKQNLSLESDGMTWIDREEEEYCEQLRKQKKLSYKLIQVLIWLKDNVLAKMILIVFGASIGFYISQSRTLDLPQSQKQKNITQQPCDDP